MLIGFLALFVFSAGPAEAQKAVVGPLASAISPTPIAPAAPAPSISAPASGLAPVPAMAPWVAGPLGPMQAPARALAEAPPVFASMADGSRRLARAADSPSIAAVPVSAGLSLARATLKPLDWIPGGKLLAAPARLGLDVLEEQVAPLIGTKPRGGPAGPDIYQEAEFEIASGWDYLDKDPRFSQRMKLRGSRMYTETRGAIRAPLGAVRDALRAPWDWWKNGVYEKRRELPDGRIKYRLWPAGKLGGMGIYVDETMYPPEALPDGGLRIRVDLEGHVNGIAYFELHPRHDGSTLVLGRFAGTEISGILPRLMGSRMVARNHLLAESGTLGFPFPSGTGWVGLIERLEARYRP